MTCPQFFINFWLFSFSIIAVISRETAKVEKKSKQIILIIPISSAKSIQIAMVKEQCLIFYCSTERRSSAARRMFSRRLDGWMRTRNRYKSHYGRSNRLVRMIFFNMIIKAFSSLLPLLLLSFSLTSSRSSRAISLNLCLDESVEECQFNYGQDWEVPRLLLLHHLVPESYAVHCEYKNIRQAKRKKKRQMATQCNEKFEEKMPLRDVMEQGNR